MKCTHLCLVGRGGTFSVGEDKEEGGEDFPDRSLVGRTARFMLFLASRGKGGGRVVGLHLSPPPSSFATPLRHGEDAHDDRSGRGPRHDPAPLRRTVRPHRRRQVGLPPPPLGEGAGRGVDHRTPTTWATGSTARFPVMRSRRAQRVREEGSGSHPGPLPPPRGPLPSSEWGRTPSPDLPPHGFCCPGPGLTVRLWSATAGGGWRRGST